MGFPKMDCFSIKLRISVAVENQMPSQPNAFLIPLSQTCLTTNFSVSFQAFSVPFSVSFHAFVRPFSVSFQAFSAPFSVSSHPFVNTFSVSSHPFFSPFSYTVFSKNFSVSSLACTTHFPASFSTNEMNVSPLPRAHAHHRTPQSQPRDGTQHHTHSPTDSR